MDTISRTIQADHKIGKIHINDVHGRRIMAVFFPPDEGGEDTIRNVVLSNVEEDDERVSSSIKGRKHIEQLLTTEGVDHVIIVASNLAPQAIELLRVRDIEGDRPFKVTHQVFDYKSLLIGMITSFEDQPTVRCMTGDEVKALEKRCISKDNLMRYSVDDPLIKIYDFKVGDVLEFRSPNAQCGEEIEYGMVYHPYEAAFWSSSEDVSRKK